MGSPKSPLSASANSRSASLSAGPCETATCARTRSPPIHRAANLHDTVPDAHDSGLSSGIEIAPALLADNPAALALDRDRKRLFEVSGEESATRRHDSSAGRS